MAAINPTTVRVGERIRADHHNAVVEQLGKQQLQSLEGFGLVQTSGGITGKRLPEVKAVQQVAPFAVRLRDGGAFSIRGGTVVFNGEAWTVANSPTFEVTGATTAQWVWLTTNSTTDPTAITWASGTTGWDNYPQQPAAPTVDNFLLVQVTGTTGSITTITKAWQGGDVIWPSTAGYPSAANPFQIFQYSSGTTNDWRNVRVHRGYINADHPDNDAESGSPIDIQVPASTASYKVYLVTGYTAIPACIDQAAGVVIDSCTISHGTGWWAGHPAQMATSGNFWYNEIGTVSAGVDNPTTDPLYQDLVISQILTDDTTINFPSTLWGVASKDGGFAGSSTGDCTWTYTAADLCGNTLLYTASPKTSRIPTVEYAVPATSSSCLMYLDASGRYQLYHVSGEKVATPTVC